MQGQPWALWATSWGRGPGKGCHSLATSICLMEVGPKGDAMEAFKTTIVSLF